MKTPFKALEINEKDNVLTAVGKGFIEGAVVSSLFWLIIGGGMIVAGKLQQQVEENEVETTEDEAGE